MLAQVFPLLVFNAHLMFRRGKQAVLFIFWVVVPTRITVHAIFAASLGIVVIPFLSLPAYGAEWSMVPSLRLSYEQNDNIRLTLQPHNSVHGSTIAPRLDMGVQSGSWGITGTTAVSRKRYSGEQDLDRDTESFGLSSRHSTERSNFSINVTRVNDTTLVDDPEDPDLGRVTVQRDRRTETIRPTWTWTMSGRSQLQLSYQLSETSYASGESIGLYDYENHTTTATWSYLLSPRSVFFFTANYSKFRVPDMNTQSQTTDGNFLVDSTFSSVDSTTPSLRAGFGHTFSETMQGSLMLGRRKTSMERTVTDCRFLFGVFFAGCTTGTRVVDDAGTTFSGNLKKKFEKLNVTANVNRDLAVSGAGTETETDLLNIQFDYPFTTRLKGIFTVSGSEARHITDMVGTTSAATNIKQYSIQPALLWQWTPEANLSVAYQYRHLKRESDDQAVQSRAIYLAFIYTWSKLSISR